MFSVVSAGPEAQASPWAAPLWAPPAPQMASLIASADGGAPQESAMIAVVIVSGFEIVSDVEMVDDGI